MERKEKLVEGTVYHIFNRSIADFKIFNNDLEYLRIKNMIRYYQIESADFKFSKFITLEKIKEDGFNSNFISFSQGKEKLVQIIAYCIMPTHFHLILKQLKEKGISIFMRNILNSYSHYFNIKHKRKGPLWESRFQNKFVETDEQLLHLTRYVHLNPVTAFLVDKPEQWLWSSYNEYLSKVDKDEKVCDYEGILDVEPVSYGAFTDERIDYQRELAKLKDL